MNIWEFINTKLEGNHKTVLMVVVDSQGSSPGQQGFKMAVADDGSMIGSVGGGIMEYKLVELVKAQFQKEQAVFLIKQDHKPQASEGSSGMICSGSQEIAFYPLDSGFLPMLSSLLNSKTGSLLFSQKGMLLDRGDSPSQAYLPKLKSQDKWLYTESLDYTNYLYIFGAGHVSVAVSSLFKQLGFHITVFDNRDMELTTFKANTYANYKQIINYQEAAKYVPEGDQVYVVIMTFGHQDDRKILKSLLNKKVKYLGMMGSKEKVSSIYSKLIEQGISDEKFSRVDAPIGLPINSQTPDEIAISIAAKIISIKNAV
ncbi:MAG: XdhC family protein [Bacteroidales bacterium]|nr:XdhC family protein [Bacteroidales bacterium]